MRFLLDTNVLSELVRRPLGTVAERVLRTGIDVVGTSIIAAAEVRFGVAKRMSKELAHNVAEVLGSMQVAPFEPPADAIYGDLRARLERVGKPIGGNDLLIAAHAIALDCTLVTNDREFSRIEGLRVEDWLSPR